MDGEKNLRDGLRTAPKSAMLHHALGLALVRTKRADQALAEFERATILEPTNARFSYGSCCRAALNGQIRTGD
jgi:Flp pilus assembly protein TadD